ncbi:uncharacterized protein LOC134821858 [Bolinopsis microptera]|uniref:uncharacterized protein LOC134821858 n=1 Tax=Bolinopsis microptera TaxID=2820187 RepID=UPI0030795C33
MLITVFVSTLLLLPAVTLGDVVCGGVTCSNIQTCCADQEACCMKSSTSSLAAIVGVMFVVCLTATGLGICLYFKKRVHRDTAYTTDDIEGMFATSLYKEMKSKVEPTLSNQTVPSRNGSMRSRENMMTSRDNLSAETPGLICEDIPNINPGSQHTELAVMQSAASNYSIPGSVISRDHMMASRQASIGTVTSIDRATGTESVETQVTSAKRTVVTVNLNMKEKENIKLNIFMNKDRAEAVAEEVESNASFPRGLSAKLGRKKSAKRSSSSSGDQKVSAASITKKEPVKKMSSKSSGRPKTPVKQKVSGRASSAKKKKKT